MWRASNYTIRKCSYSGLGWPLNSMLSIYLSLSRSNFRRMKSLVNDGERQHENCHIAHWYLTCEICKWLLNKLYKHIHWLTCIYPPELNCIALRKHQFEDNVRGLCACNAPYQLAVDRLNEPKSKAVAKCTTKLANANRHIVKCWK